MHAPRLLLFGFSAKMYGSPEMLEPLKCWMSSLTCHGMSYVSARDAPHCDSVLEGGHRLICSRGEFKYAGVAILIHSRWAHMISRCRRVSHWVLSLDLQMYNYNYRIIRLYVPHAGYSVAAFDECFDDIRTSSWTHSIVECAVCRAAISTQNFTRVGEGSVWKNFCSRPISMFAMTQFICHYSFRGRFKACWERKGHWIVVLRL